MKTPNSKFQIPGAACQYHHPERMEITQTRVARNELPWVSGFNSPSLKGLILSDVGLVALSKCAAKLQSRRSRVEV